MSGHVQCAARPPAGWDGLVPLARQRTGFGDAMRAMGYRPLYLWDGADRRALALVRGGFPVLRRLTARANVILHDPDHAFVMAVLRVLGRSGITHVKIGDTTWGLPWEQLPGGWSLPRTHLVVRHSFRLDLDRPEATLLAQMEGAARKIRKAEREKVVVRPVDTSADLAAFCRLAQDTADRVRARSAYTEYPPAFFRRLFETLVPAARARFYLGWHGEQPLAGALFLLDGDTMLYYLGGSTRDRDLTSKQAPSAVFWHAIQEARRWGMRYFDLGGCTPTEDADDPRAGVYAFKRRWGGRLVSFTNLDVVLAAVPFFVQERVLSPVWDRVHPWYFALLNRGKARA